MATPTTQFLLDNPIISIIRVQDSSAIQHITAALFAGGIQLVEVTLTTPGALHAIENARSQFDAQLLFGAGSVLDPESARAAILAGAQFIVTPTYKAATIEMCKRYGIPIICGAYSPTEILSAWEAGADIVKVFPIDQLGAGYIKATKAPMPQLKLAAVGGVDATNAAEYLRAGADSLGIGSSLVNSQLIAAGKYDEITRRASELTAIVRDARGLTGELTS